MESSRVRRSVADSAAKGRELVQGTKFSQLLTLQQSDDAQLVSTVGCLADAATSTAIHGGRSRRKASMQQEPISLTGVTVCLDSTKRNQRFDIVAGHELFI